MAGVATLAADPGTVVAIVAFSGRATPLVLNGKGGIQGNSVKDIEISGTRCLGVDFELSSYGGDSLGSGADTGCVNFGFGDRRQSLVPAAFKARALVAVRAVVPGIWARILS